MELLLSGAPVLAFPEFVRGLLLDTDDEGIHVLLICCHFFALWLELALMEVYDTDDRSCLIGGSA